MQIKNAELIEDLLNRTRQAITTAKRLKDIGIVRLTNKNSPGEWNALECIEHLNLYGDFYLPAIEKGLLSSPGNESSPVFKSGMIGNYFANLMKAENGKIKKMRSPKDKNPLNTELTLMTVERFIKQLEKLVSLLNAAKKADLTKIKIPISLTRLIKLRLGDTFRFFIYHIERHLMQAERASVLKRSNAQLV